MQRGSPVLAVRTVLSFLLLTPVAPQCRPGTDVECQRNPPYISGLQLTKYGFDITVLNRSSGELMDMTAWQGTGGSCTVCENSLLKRRKLQKLPLAVTNWKANSLCRKVEHGAFDSIVSVINVMTKLTVKNDWKTDLDLEQISEANHERILAGSRAPITLFSETRGLYDHYVFLLHYATCSYYKFNIDKDKAVTQVFKDDVQKLPGNYDSNSKAAYHRFIESYGTHFVTEYELGAMVMFLTAVPLCRIKLKEFKLSEIDKCMEIEMRYIINLDDVTKDPDFQKCKDTIEEITKEWMYRDQLRYIEGAGPYTPVSPYFNYSFFEPFPHPSPEDWLEDVIADPAVLTYALEPLHALVDKTDTRRESLRQAIGAYVRERVKWSNCTPFCPAELQMSSSDSCFCECPNNNITNSKCCPKERGLAQLSVTIKSATGLWGDYFTRTDAYVSVRFKDKVLCTHTIWNSNNPKWNVKLDFGYVQLTERFSHIEIKVWDEDLGVDNALGKCIVSLSTWDPSDHVCYLNRRARLIYKYYLSCIPRLGGPICRDYFHLFPWQERKMHFHNKV